MKGTKAMTEGWREKQNFSSISLFQDLKLLSCKHMVVLWTMSETMKKK